MKVAIDYVMYKLGELYNLDDARLWLASPNQYLQEMAPIDLIKCGRTSEVLRLIDQIREGVYL